MIKNPFAEKEIESYDVRCEMAEINLSQSYSPNRLFYMVSERLGDPSILVNNAVYSTHTRIEELDVEQLDKHYTVNVRATMLLSSLFIKHYSLKTGGSIINLTSGQSVGPMPDELAYAATKGAIEAFTKSIAPVAMEKGITVNAVDPGPTNTGWITEELKHHLVWKFPQGKSRRTVDAARLISF